MTRSKTCRLFCQSTGSRDCNCRFLNCESGSWSNSTQTPTPSIFLTVYGYKAQLVILHFSQRLMSLSTAMKPCALAFRLLRMSRFRESDPAHWSSCRLWICGLWGMKTAFVSYAISGPEKLTDPLLSAKVRYLE